MPPLFGRSIEHRQRESLTTQVLRDLSARLDKGELKPGDRLPTERELMAAYGVSRTVVREAVSSLRSSGRIATQQGRGAWVLDPPPALAFRLEDADLNTVQDVLQVMEIRIALESEAAALAAARRTNDQLAALGQAFEALEASIAKPDSSAEYDVRFHLEIARATGNSYFTELYGGLAPRLVPRARLDLFKNDPDGKIAYLQRIQQEHDQIYQAIGRGDSEAARAAMRLHLTNSRERLRAALDRRGEAG